MTTATRITLASRPKGAPTPENFALQTADLPAPGPGEFALKTLWLSLDPYMRGRMDDAESYAPAVQIGEAMTAQGVGEVTASNHPDYQPGDIVLAPTGWASAGVFDGEGCRKIDPSAAPIQTALGPLGMPGFTAFVGLNDIGAAKSGETIVVSAATGAVGSMVGQLAKAKGLRVIGVAGGAQKCDFAVSELGFDACFDHHAHDAKSLSAAIAEAAPQGVDLYYENVGGKTTEATISNMNTHGRIIVCGMIAWYSGKGIAEAAPAPYYWRNILTRRLRVQGFIIFDHNDRFDAFFKEVAPMLADGQLKYRETVTEGLKNAPEAFIGMLNGQNFGKQLVRVA